MIYTENYNAENQWHTWRQKARNAGDALWAQQFLRLVEHMDTWGDFPSTCSLYVGDNDLHDGLTKEFSFVLEAQKFDEYGSRIARPDPISRDDGWFIMNGVLYNHGDNDNPEWGIHT
jgi:hypothetical protein